MFLPGKSKQTEQKQQMVDAREAFNLWDILNSKYTATERLDISRHFTHDADLKYIFGKLKKPIDKNIRVLEKMMTLFAIESPERNPAPANPPANPEVFSDRFLALDIFFYLQEHMENLLKAMRSTFSNDWVRKKLKVMTISTIEELDSYIIYLRLKGFLAVPPRYRNVPQNVTEDFCLCEAADLWDHLTYRYDNRKTTEVFGKIAHDADFRLVLYLGAKQLSRQIKLLEKEARHFGLPMPRRPGKFTMGITDKQVFDDTHIYRVLISNLQGAAILHAQSFKECTVNDRVRKLFKQLLLEEIDLLDRFIKLGKLKGWTNPAPKYGP